MAIDINFPPLQENNNEELLNLSLLITSPHPQPPQPPQPQPNIQLQQQPQLNIQLQEQPQPKGYKPNPFHFQYIPQDTPNPSSLLVEHDFLEFLQPRQHAPSLQENHSLVPPNPIMHEQELPLPSPCDLSSQEPNPNAQDDQESKELVLALKQVKTDTITPPYPWATSKRATVQSIEYLLSNNIVYIPGVVKCKRCREQYDIHFDLMENFNEVATFIIEERDNMHDRVSKFWEKPVLLTCKRCRQENCLVPVLEKKRNVNWLFLLLGQMIGFCNIYYLKYFCKHTKNHRTGAKDRLL